MKQKMRIFIIILMMWSLLIPQMPSVQRAEAMYTVYVCTDVDGYLNMRSTPSSSISSNIVAKLPDCVPVYIDFLSDNGKWGYGTAINAKGNYVSGWVYLPLTRYTYEEARENAGTEYYATVVVASYDGELNLRSEAGEGYGNIIDVIYNGTVLYVTRKTDMGWGLVSYNGQKGWIKLEPYTKKYTGAENVAPQPTSATNIIGYAKYTDIVAYINHYPITSYNVNDQTVVVAEDLRNYGFDVRWYEDTRTLHIYRGTSTTITPYGTVYKYASKKGQNFLPCLKTDIKTYVNESFVPSYNIDGKTVVNMEDLNIFGEVIWVPETRALKMWIEGLPIAPFSVPKDIRFGE